MASPPDSDKPTVQVGSVPLVYIGILLAATLQVLDTTIANVAVPHMQSSLNATRESVLWVLTSYIVASAIALPSAGWLSSRFGSRRLLITSTVLFILSSMLCGMAANLEQMVLFRFIQGFAGAYLMPLSQTIMLDVTRPSRHGQAMALFGAGVIMGPIMGPVFGGWLTENMNWRWVFYVNLPFGAIALLLMITQLPPWPTRKQRFDITGYALVALCVGSLQLLMDRGEHIDWFDAAEAWVYALLFCCTAWIGVIHLATSRNPIFNRALWHDMNFTISLAIMAVTGLTAYATLALMPPMLQQLFGYSVLTTGLVIAPRGIGVMLCALVAGRLVRKGFDLRIMVALGFTTIAISMFDMASWSLTIERHHIVTAGIIQGVGLGLLFIPLNTLAFSTLPAPLRADGSSLVNLFRSIGASVGISVSSVLLARSIQTNHAELAPYISTETIGITDPERAGMYGKFGESILAMADAEINRQAAMIGYINDFWFMGWLCLAAVPMVLLIRRPDQRMAPVTAEAIH